MDVDASDAGDPRLILSSHRAIDAIGGFVPPTDLRALSVVSKTAGDSRVLIATKRVVTQRCTALAASKRARRRLEAVDAMGRFLGPAAEGFLTAIFRDDKLQTVRAAAATWLARVARRADPLTKQRIFAAACERYDAETGRMTVLQAIRDAFTDVYDDAAEYARMNPTGGALAKFVATTLAAREVRLQRHEEFLKTAAAGVMGGKIHLFRENADGFGRVHFKLDRGRDDSVKLAFANPLERSVLLRRYESRGLCRDDGLSVVEIPPRSVRHFLTVEFYRGTAFTSSFSDRPQGRWLLSRPSTPVKVITGKSPTEKVVQRDWTALLRLEARFRARGDQRGAEDCGREPPFELWTFELRPDALTCRVDRPGRPLGTPLPLGTRYHPQPPPPPPSAQWRQSLSHERIPTSVVRRRPGAPPPKYTHSEWLHRYPDPAMPPTLLARLDLEARPSHPRRQFLFSDEAEPRACETPWPGTLALAARAAAVGCAWCGRADDITEVGGMRLCESCRRQSGQ